MFPEKENTYDMKKTLRLRHSYAFLQIKYLNSVLRNTDIHFQK